MLTMTATATDPIGIAKVVFMVKKIGVAEAVYTFEDLASPYAYTFDTRALTNGSSYVVQAQAFDNTGTGGMDSHGIVVAN